MKRPSLLLLTAALAGCIVFDKKSEAVAFHQFATPAAPAATGGPLVLVPRATLPPAVRRPAVVMLTPAGEVLIDDAHRWAAPLDRLVADSLARHLERATGATTASQTPAQPHLTLILEFERFEVVAERRAALTVDYRFELADGSALAGGRSACVEPMKELSAPEFVAAQSRNLAKAGDAIAATLRAIPAQRLPSR
ncbi:MAG: hypothetical protein RL250_793 [Verrucomicrobiota bacterium]|jgi:uncharacterized lipoprotein YmbA